MIVEQTGYLKLENIIDLLQNGVKFCIYKTHKNTNILVTQPFGYGNSVSLFYPKKDRLPYKLVQGRRIIDGTKIFDSESKTDIFDNINWNNGNQIMSYKSLE